jgi:hypothetical protein
LFIPIRDARLVNILILFLFFFKFIGADDLHTTESKRGVCSAGDLKKKNSEREKRKTGCIGIF